VTKSSKNYWNFIHGEDNIKSVNFLEFINNVVQNINNIIKYLDELKKK
jgi:hypothetical protein